MSQGLLGSLQLSWPEGEGVAKPSGGPSGALFPFYWTSGSYTSYEPLGKYDANGTFVYNYSGSWLYHPYMIGRLSCEIYARWYKLNDSTPLSKFRDQILWIRANEKQFGDHSVWFYNYTANERDTDPWWSSLGNAWIIAALLDSYSLDKNPVDLEIAWRGMKAFNYDLENHGVLTSWNGTVWYEEEAGNNSLVIQTPSHILNGMIIASSGPLYIFDFNGSAIAKGIFNDGMAAVKTHVKEYDTGMWERYSMLNPRVNLEYIGLHKHFFGWAANESGDSVLNSWYIRTSWMKRLPEMGYTPANITAERTVDPVNFGTEYIVDKQLTALTPSKKYWSGWLRSNLTFDLGSILPVNFIGYYGMAPGSSPKNYTVKSSVDGTNWVLRATVLNSTDFDKCVAFNDSFQAQYVKFDFFSNIKNSTIVGLDEVIITNFTANNLMEAKTSIEDHRFKNTEGRLVGSVPKGTEIKIDGELTTNASGSSGNYTFALQHGAHNLDLRYNNISLNISVYVKFAQKIYYNATAADFVDRYPPVARAGANRTIVEGGLVFFDANRSSDNVGIVNYTWTFIYKGNLVSLYGSNVSFYFNESGQYNVVLSARDAANLTGNDTIVITVQAKDHTLQDVAILSVVILAAIIIASTYLVRKRRKKPRENLSPPIEPKT